MEPSLVLDRVTLRVPERELPVPAHISEPARIFLAAAGMQPRVPLPQTTDAAAWHAAAEAWDQRILPMIEPLLAGLPVKLERVRVGACDVHVATPNELTGVAASYAFMDIHGGALVFGGGRFAQLIAIWRAVALGCRVFGVDYRMPPGHPYPAPLDDCVAAYRYLLGKYHRAHVVVGGISAGGNLAAATVLRARDEGLPLPAAAVLLTPELDLTESGDSFFTNRDVDVALPTPLPEANHLYANGANLAHPYLSPLFGDFSKGFPPTLLQSGTRDLFLSNTVRMHRALLKAGHQAELHVWEAMPHAGFGGGSPEDVEIHETVRDFLKRVAGWAL
ncbi:MAG: alpha/beta hydrolase [Rhodospirillales bacterium]